jgi:hypothetical protein
VVHVYELDPATFAYAPTGIFHDRLKLTGPYSLEVDFAELDPL